MGYKINSVTGEMSEYIFDFGGILALRNFTARTNGNRLIIHSAENANFTILDALVNEVEIDGVVYDNPTTAQEALQRLVFNPTVPVILTKQEREIIDKFKEWTGKGLCDDETQQLRANILKSYKLPANSKLFAIELLGDTTIEVGTTQTNIGDLGEMTGSNGSVMNFGLLSISEVWLRSSSNVDVVPIIYKK